MYDFSVVLPCYNPLEKWKETISNNLVLLRKEFNVEFVVVNDGSIFNFNEKDVRSFFSVYPEIKIVSYTENKGKGYAVREGVKAAASEFIIYTDIDFPYTHESFLKIYSALKNENTDVAIGIRGEEYYTHLSKTRIRISKLLRWFIKKFLRIPTDDTQCGLKGFNQKGKNIFLKTTINRYLFDLEFVFFAAREKVSIKTIPVTLLPEIVLSKMNWKILLHEFSNFLKIFFKSLIRR